MTRVRSCHVATRGGRELEVRCLRPGRWVEVVGGKLVGPDLAPDDFETLVVVRTVGLVDDQEFDVISAPGDLVHIYTVSDVRRDLRERLGLTGSWRDGWGGRVPVTTLTGLREVVVPSKAGPGHAG